MKNRIRWFPIVALLSLIVLAFGALAQTVSNAPPDLNATDQKVHDLVARFSAWKFLIAPLTMLLVAAVKRWAAFIPDKFLPWTSPIIGAFLDYAGGKFGFWTGDLAAGAAVGGLATWAHQSFIVQPKEPGGSGGEGGGRSGRLGLWFLLGALSIGAFAPLSGCAWFRPSTVAVGSDAAVVGAEQTAKLALAYTSEFLKWEWINRGSVGADVTQLADAVRGEFPKSYADFRAATKAYKLNRSAGNRVTLGTAQAVIDALLVRVRARLPSGVRAKAVAASANINLN